MRLRMRSSERAALRTSIAPDGLKFGHVLAAAECVGGPRELQDRADLVAQEQVGGEQQQDAERHGPDDEDVRGDDDHALAVHARFVAGRRGPRRRMVSRSSGR